jgi:proliferating cell nuclear antigen
MCGCEDLFRLRLADARLWRSLIAAISTLVDEASFTADKWGIRLRAMDPSHIAMVDFEWPKSVFEEYTCEEETRICVNVNEMLKLLRRIGGDESIELSLEQNRINFVLRGRYTRSFGMSTLAPSTEEIPTPKISFNASARVTTGLLRSVLEDAQTVSDHVNIEFSQSKLTLKASGDVGNVAVEVEKGVEELLSLEVKEPSTATFSLNYLLEIVKMASNLSEVALVELSTDMPIRLSFELPQSGRLQYYLAPRIESTS